MKNKVPELAFSEPVKDIMGTPPRKIVRWGTGVIFSVFILFIVFAWFLKYPDVIPAAIEITTENPPVILVSKISGKIKNINIQDKEKVVTGQVLAAMETTASLTDFETLKKFILTVNLTDTVSPSYLPLLMQLGELQEPYEAFLKVYSDHYNYIKNDFYGKKVNSVKDEISGLKTYMSNLLSKEKLYNENLVLEKRKYLRDSVLNKNKVIPDIDLENSRQAYLRQRIDLQQSKLDYSAKIIELAERQQVLQDYIVKGTEEQELLRTSLNESFKNLNARILIWEQNYLLISPIDGKVTFTRYWSNNQTVTLGEAVLSIIPDNPGEFLGRINLKMVRSGKVKEGQLVNIKLNSYPYLEYGMVRGVVSSKSLVPGGEGYVIEIRLPTGLKTLYGKELEFSQNMTGTAEIITDDIRLLQKILNPFRYIISRNKM